MSSCSSTPHLLIFGMGYSASHLARRLRVQGWRVTGVRRAADEEAIAFADQRGVMDALQCASHVLSSVPPDIEGTDPVLTQYGDAIAAASLSWAGYLSSSGVYGDTGGAWVDESAPIGQGRRSARAMADLGWQALRPDMRIFRLPGIYGPGRSAIERVREGRVHMIDLPQQVFSRIHVDDIAGAVVASFTGPPGIYNIADDHPCSQNEVISHACALLGVTAPPLMTIEDVGLSRQARAFYAENRRVANGRAKRLLGWEPLYPDYRAGLTECLDGH
ncbi:MAG: SDR family NAD(P)-dependent oxidoreductase [Sphingobium sp.]|nr:SDR family NAD(P)-dependent oxidoreductase [Sphingobium sp.]